MTLARSRPLASRKILDLPGLLQLRATARSSGKTLVHCHGCFDIVHPGHIRYFQFAKQQGDLLLVSLTADPHVGKGEGRPYIPQELRAENLAALEFVDAVYVNPTPTAVDLLSTLKPDIYIKGREYEHNQHPGFLKERHAVEAYGGRVIFSSGDVIYSSSHIIDSYAAGGGGRIDLEQEKLALFCKRYNVRRSSLLHLMDAIVDRPFTVIGDLVLDRYQYCDASDIAPDAPNMSLVPLEHRDFLGGAAIIARHLAGLGAEPTLITSLGTDDASDAALDTLESAGVHVLPIRNRKKIATKTRFVVDTQKLFTLDECPSTPTDSTNERYVLDQARKLANVEGQAASLILYDAGLGVLTDSVASALLKQCRSKETPAEARYAKICAGTASSRGKLTRLIDVDLLVATERAIRIATRDHEQGVSALACRILMDHRAAGLLMPLGKKGLMTFDAPDPTAFANPTAWEGKLRSEYLASPINGTIDRLGTDEALLATAAALLSATHTHAPNTPANLQQAAYAALLASILQSRTPGHAPLDGHELRTLLDNRPELAD